MGKIHAELVREFYMGEDDAVLVAADREGIEELETAVRSAVKSSESGILRTGQQTHLFLVEHGAAIEFRNDQVVWRFSIMRMEDLADKMEAMRMNPGPCHQYFDILAPVTTLVISRDEYPDRLA